MAKDDLPEQQTAELARTAWLRAVEARISKLETPPAFGRDAADKWFEPLGKWVRERVGLMPWVRYSELGAVLSTDASHRQAAFSVPLRDASATKHTHVGLAVPTVGKRYRVDFPYHLPDPPVSVLRGPVPYLDPWAKIPGGSGMFYAIGKLNRYAPHWPQGTQVAVMAIDWPLPSAADARPADLVATAVGTFDFTAQSSGSRDIGPARFLGVDGLGNLWATLGTQPGTPVVSYLANIPALGTGTPSAHMPCPDDVIPVAVDATPGHSGLLSVDQGRLVEEVLHAHIEYADGTISDDTTYHKSRRDSYTVKVGTVDPDSRTVAWRTGGSLSGRGTWLIFTWSSYYRIRSDPTVKVPYSVTTAPLDWTEMYHVPMTQGKLEDDRQNTVWAYAYPPAELMHALWTDATGRQRWRAAFLTFPDPRGAAGPFFYANPDGLQIEDERVIIPNTDGLQFLGPVVPMTQNFPYRQTELDVGRYASYLAEDGSVRSWAVPGFPYGMWGAGPSGDGEWAMVTRIPTRRDADMHYLTDLKAVIQSYRGEHGLNGVMAPFPAHGEFTLARIIARSRDGTQILAEDTNGTYNADEQSLSPGRLWQTVDGGVTWTRLAFRITDLPASGALVPQGYGFIVDAAG